MWHVYRLFRLFIIVIGRTLSIEILRWLINYTQHCSIILYNRSYTAGVCLFCGTFTEVKRRRPQLVLGWVTVMEDWALWASVRSSVWTLICDRYRADTDVKWIKPNLDCAFIPFELVKSLYSILTLSWFPYVGISNL